MADTTRIYLSGDQCEMFGVPYHCVGERLDISAQALLASGSYDEATTRILQPIAGRTLCLVGTGRGWFTVEQVI